MVDGDTVQALDERCAVRVLGAVEDTVKDGLVFTVDVVVLQEPTQCGNTHATSVGSLYKAHGTFQFAVLQCNEPQHFVTLLKELFACRPTYGVTIEVIMRARCLYFVTK